MKTLTHTPDRVHIEARLATLQVRDKAVWGVMSVGQMVCHLRGAFEMASGDRRAAPMKMPLPPRVVKWLALTLPLRWPGGVPTVAELKSEGTPGPADFASDLNRTQAAMQRFLSLRANRTAHPMFGAMNPADWMRWGYLHTDHHLRQFGR